MANANYYWVEVDYSFTYQNKESGEMVAADNYDSYTILCERQEVRAKVEALVRRELEATYGEISNFRLDMCEVLAQHF